MRYHPISTLLARCVGLLMLTMLLAPSLLQAQRDTLLLGIQNARLLNPNQARYAFGERIGISYDLYNVSENPVSFSIDNTDSIEIVYTILQEDSIVLGPVVHQRISPSNMIIRGGESIPIDSIPPLIINSNLVAGGGTVVVIWPRGAMVIPRDSSTIEFELYPTSRLQARAAPEEGRLYPNPSATLPQWSLAHEVESVRIYSLSGRFLLAGREPDALEAASTALPEGLYIIEMRMQNGNIERERWIKLMP